MDWSWRILFLVALATGVHSQVQLVQSEAEVRKPGESVKVSCKASGYTFNSYGINWVRQAPGKSLEYMGWIKTNSGNPTYVQDFSGRFFFSVDTSVSTAYLHISSLNSGDTAIYYCVRRDSSSWPPLLEYWGQGTLVTVSSEAKTSPSVFPLSLSSPDAAGYVVIACLVQGFFPPEPVNVTWSPSKDGASIRNFPPVKATTGSLYTMSSQLTLPANQCPADSSLKCQVQHLSNPSKTVDVPCLEKCDKHTCNCPACEQPRLALHPPALEDLLLGSNASLTCTLSGLKDPKDASFTWTASGGKDAIQKAPERDSCGCYSVSSVLPGCAEPWNRGDTFFCKATHPEATSPITVNISKPLGNTFRPQVHLLPPPSEELALNELVSLTCFVRGFSPKDVLIRWLQGTQELPPEKYLTWEPLQEPGQSVATFAATSVLRVDAEAWRQGDKFSCMVGHEALPLSFTQKTIDRLAGKPTHVNVSVVMAEVDGVCY